MTIEKFIRNLSRGMKLNVAWFYASGYSKYPAEI